MRPQCKARKHGREIKRENSLLQIQLKEVFKHNQWFPERPKRTALMDVFTNALFPTTEPFPIQRTASWPTVMAVSLHNVIDDIQWTKWTNHRFQVSQARRAWLRIRWTLESVALRPKNIPYVWKHNCKVEFERPHALLWSLNSEAKETALV